VVTPGERDVPPFSLLWCGRGNGNPFVGSFFSVAIVNSDGLRGRDNNGGRIQPGFFPSSSFFFFFLFLPHLWRLPPTGWPAMVLKCRRKPAPFFPLFPFSSRSRGEVATVRRCSKSSRRWLVAVLPLFPPSFPFYDRGCRGAAGAVLDVLNA